MQNKNASRAGACARQPRSFPFAMAIFGILKSTTSKVKMEVGERLCPEVNIFSLHLLFEMALFGAARAIKKYLFWVEKLTPLRRGESPAACRGGGGPLIRNAQQYLNFATFGSHFPTLTQGKCQAAHPGTLLVPRANLNHQPLTVCRRIFDSGSY